MRHEETRDNTTAIEALMMAGDAEEILVGLGHSPDKADRMVNGDAKPAKILPVIVTVDKLPRLACDYPKPYNPQHVVDGVAVEVVEDDDPEDDGQPSEYEEWQDYMGGDDWDHGQYDDCGW